MAGYLHAQTSIINTVLPADVLGKLNVSANSLHELFRDAEGIIY